MNNYYDERDRPRNRERLHRLLDAFRQFTAEGRSGHSCEECGEEITFRRLDGEAWESSCQCGKYNEVLRGI